MGFIFVFAFKSVETFFKFVEKDEDIFSDALQIFLSFCNPLLFEVLLGNTQIFANILQPTTFAT